ncbi:phage tail tape measure protein [Brucella sp. 2280]|uniref:phage tail tape measure protein n=1 Tax=Brucella sp. 2280 TaxID=2592625 RepID=UPI0012968C81|nr:phage tail tape measure protein [Brucella sp. 2280]QGA57776.1 phage tail tape measure protein [Brucella sp. 2280]
MVEATAVAYALYRAFKSPVEAATEFETKLEDIAQKIEAPISTLPELGREIRQVARDTYQSASAMADGMDVLAGMGANREDALGMLPAIGRTATAYNAEIADLAQAGYAALSNLKVPANQLSGALDAMAQAGKDGAFELKDMAKYFPQLGAGYQALGQQGVPAVADLSAALQIVRKGTGDSASAATNLTNVLQKINAPLTRKTFQKMGVNLEKEMNKAAKAGLTPIEAIAEITHRTLKGDLGKLGDLFQDAQVQQGLRPLIQNIEEYRRIRESAMKAQGVVQQDYERRLRTNAATAKRFRISMENVALAIGSALLPAMNNLADVIVPIVNRMAEFAEAHPQLTAAIVATSAALVGLRIAAIAAQFSLLWLRGGLISSAILSLKAFRGALAGLSLVFAPVSAAFRGLRTTMIGYAAAASIAGNGTALSIMGRSLVGLLNPLRLVSAAFRGLKFALIGSGIGAIAIGIAMAGTWIYNNWQGIKELMVGIGEGFRAGLAPVQPILRPVVDLAKRLWDSISGLVGPLQASTADWRAWGEVIGGAVASGVNSVASGINTIVGLFQSAYEGAIKLKQAFGNLFGSGRYAPSNPYTSNSAGAKFGRNAPWLPPQIAGAKAAGGPVVGGRTYLVGEKGPELFTADRSGTIIPNGGKASFGGTGGGFQIGQLHVHGAPGMDEQTLAHKVIAEIERRFRMESDGIQADMEYAVS